MGDTVDTDDQCDARDDTDDQCDARYDTVDQYEFKETFGNAFE